MDGFTILVWFALCVWVGSAASDKGRSGFLWFLSAFLFSPLLAGLILAFCKDLNTEAKVKKVEMEHQQLKDRVVSNERLTEHRLNKVESNVTLLQSGNNINYGLQEQKIKMLADDTKTCPACAETIKAAAIKCKHCGTMLNEFKKKECPFCNENILESDVICKHCNSALA